MPRPTLPLPLIALAGALAPFDLAAKRSQPFWITLYAPRAAKPGAYRFRLVLRQGPKQIGRLDFRATVTRAEVPARQTLKVTNWFTWGDERLQRHYPAPAAKPEKKWELLENIGRVIAAHRQNVILTPVLSLTDARLDRFIETFDRAAMAGTIEGGKVARRRLPPKDARVELHLRSRGWLERYVQHIHDEPQPEAGGRFPQGNAGHLDFGDGEFRRSNGRSRPTCGRRGATRLSKRTRTG